MKRTTIALSLISMLAFAVPVTEANDIEDLFKAAFRGSSSSHRHGDSRHRQASYRDRGRGPDRGYRDRDFDFRRTPRRTSSFNLSIGVNNSRLNVARGPRVAVVPAYPVLEAPRPVLPVAPVPVIPIPDPDFHNHGPAFPAPPVPVTPVPRIEVPILPANVHSRFGYGDIVSCPVPLYTRVKVRDRDNIHPRAVDVVVAVKDPNACRHSCKCCEKRNVFVRICVPPCPPEEVTVSRDGTRMELDYGDYEVDITSRSGVVTVDYDD